MRISDWSSDVCSSDLVDRIRGGVERADSGDADRPALAEQIAAREGQREQASRDEPHADAPGRHVLRFSHAGADGGTRTRTPKWIADFKSAASTGSATRSEEHTSELQSLMRISYAVF